jgi:hypothetical protein
MNPGNQLDPWSQNKIKILFPIRKNSKNGVFAPGAEPPILEFLRTIRRHSDFGGFNLNIIKIKILFPIRKNSKIGVFATGAEPPILEFWRTIRRHSDFGGLNLNII